MSLNGAAREWVEKTAGLTKPDNIVLIEGGREETERLTRQALKTGDLIELDQRALPGCYLHRSALNDVARTEDLTFICTPKREDAGPTNNWMTPADAYARLGAIFDGSMRGRTMYVVPHLMGPADSPHSRAGIELTDSLYVALSMGIMTRVGRPALDRIDAGGDFVRGLHSKADLNPSRRFICHFPEEQTIWSVGSGYGGNALLGKKCFALRLAGPVGRREGWMAEHMLILGLEDPDGRVTYMAAAFPSACGKTNLAMLEPPLSQMGFRVWTIGDDIAWLHVGDDGRLWALNPEAGFFGVAPGTSQTTNPNAMRMIGRDTIFTNVLETPEHTVWWEGMGVEPPSRGLDWRSQKWNPGSGSKGAHPNSRFTAPTRNCPTISPEWQNPRGVPISAILFGGRRARLAPLVYEAFGWAHGVYVGAAMASETTAAATGQVGVVRRDPMAMLPFCGYNMGDYFAHWLEMGQRIRVKPRIFNVNWFRVNAQGEYMWPGYGENIRVLRWIAERCRGKGQAVETPVGFVPAEGSIDFDALDIPAETRQELLGIDPAAWLGEAEAVEVFLRTFDDRLPTTVLADSAKLRQRLARRAAPALPAGQAWRPTSTR
ncbi:MAG: phosphoenolpyruvate carboxykinase (GTP) [Bacillota bacterium]